MTWAVGRPSYGEKLVDSGYSVIVLDISQTAIDRARKRLGARASRVRWIVADVTGNPGLGTFDLWNDRTVFHFPTAPEARAAYVEWLTRTVLGGRRDRIMARNPHENCIEDRGRVARAVWSHMVLARSQRVAGELHDRTNSMGGLRRDCSDCGNCSMAGRRPETATESLIFPN